MAVHKGIMARMANQVRSASRRGAFFRKTVIYVLFIASIPGLLLGAGMHFVITGQIERELLAQHEEQIRQHARVIDEQLSHLEISLSHWAFEPQYEEGFRHIDFSYHFQATRDVNQNLLAKQGSHPLLYSVELYLNGIKPYMISPNETLREIKEQEQVEYYHTLIRTRGSLFWESGDLSSYNPLKLIHTIPGDSPNPYGILIVTLDEAKVKAILKTPTSQSGGTSFLIDQEKGIMFSTSKSDEMKEFDRQLADKVRAGEWDSGSFNYIWKNNNYSVSYEKFDRVNSNWMYVSAVPTTSITSPVAFISKSILYVSLAGLLIATLLSMVVSNRIYSPVRRLVGLLRVDTEDDRQQSDEFQLLEEEWRKLTAESSSLRSRMKTQLPLVKEGFLLQLIHGYLSAYSERETLERMSLLGWNVENRGFVLIYFQLTGFPHDSERFSSKDEELLTFACANVVLELAQTYYEQADVINFHDLSIGLLIAVPAGEEYRDKLRILCEEATESVNRLLHMRLTITISRLESSAQRIAHLFQEVKEASLYRDFADRNQVIELETLDVAKLDNEMKYSFALERELVQSLRMGNREEAERVLGEFLAQLTSGNGKESAVLQGMLQLLGCILNTMLQSGVNPHHLFNGINMFERLSQIREADEMLKWMRLEVIAPFTVEMMKRADDQLKPVVEKVIAHLHERYMDPNISLDSCAEFAGTNHYSLSKAFKLYTGSNFIDYLTQLRIEKAKDLLRHTELRMYDIAERVGYQNGYFNRLFKKLEGMTPRQYREVSRK